MSEKRTRNAGGSYCLRGFCVPIIAHWVDITVVWQRTLRARLSTQMRKEIRAHRLFACPAAGSALEKQQ